MEIPKDDLLAFLKEGYTEYKKSLTEESDEIDLAHVKGFCTTIEQLLSAYGDVTSAEMMEIKKPILGNISLRRKKKIDYEVPTYLRKSKKS